MIRKGRNTLLVVSTLCVREGGDYRHKDQNPPRTAARTPKLSANAGNSPHQKQIGRTLTASESQAKLPLERDDLFQSVLLVLAARQVRVAGGGRIAVLRRRRIRRLPRLRQFVHLTGRWQRWIDSVVDGLQLIRIGGGVGFQFI